MMYNLIFKWKCKIVINILYCLFFILFLIYVFDNREDYRPPTPPKYIAYSGEGVSLGGN